MLHCCSNYDNTILCFVHGGAGEKKRTERSILFFIDSSWKSVRKEEKEKERKTQTFVFILRVERHSSVIEKGRNEVWMKSYCPFLLFRKKKIFLFLLQMADEEKEDTSSNPFFGRGGCQWCFVSFSPLFYHFSSICIPSIRIRNKFQSVLWSATYACSNKGWTVRWRKKRNTNRRYCTSRARETFFFFFFSNWMLVRHQRSSNICFHRTVP